MSDILLFIFGCAIDSGRRGWLLAGVPFPNDFLELFIDESSIMLSSSWVGGRREALRLGFFRRGHRLLIATWDDLQRFHTLLQFRYISNLNLVVFIIEVAEDVVEDEIAVGLRRKDEGLHELAGRHAAGGHGTNHLNDDVVTGVLRVNVCNADFAVGEGNLLDAVVDSLIKRVSE
jgi:hypothetical protein